MSAVLVPVPTEIPGEDVLDAAHPPVPARAHLSLVPPLVADSAEFTAPPRHDGWIAAWPAWDDLTPTEHDEHRSECPDLCSWCEDNRGFGDCTKCEAPTEANDAGLSVCCGSPVQMGSPEPDGPERYVA